MSKRDLHHQYPVECCVCGKQHQIICKEPYPQYGDKLSCSCPDCEKETEHTLVLTNKIRKELNQQAAEEKLKEQIRDRCSFYGFTCRFFLQSVIIQTPVAKWQFDYHEKLKTLRHENHLYKGQGCMHYQFRDRKLGNVEVVDNIASHDGYGYKRMRDVLSRNCK